MQDNIAYNNVSIQTANSAIAKEIIALKKASKLTNRQQAALDFYLEDDSSFLKEVRKNEDSPIIKALKSAGYTGSKEALEALGRHIIIWFETNTTTADIFRLMNIGETQVIKRLKDIVERSSNLNTVISALKVIAASLNMTEGQLDEAAGASIEIVHHGETEKGNNIKHVANKVGSPKTTTITIVK